jgi:hypothetical protein
MFIRWQSRERRRPKFDPWTEPDTHWSVILAETKRIDGQPRQEHIACLGSITDSDFFWDDITAAFDKLSKKVKPEDRKRFESALAVKMPRPSAEEYKGAARNSAQSFGWKFPTAGTSWQTVPQQDFIPAIRIH